MNIIVIGCGRIGSELAYRLYRKGHQVTVVDNVAAAFENLHPEFRGRTVEGEVLAQEVLRRAGIERADGLAAVTPDDATNAVVAHLASTVFGVKDVVVRNYDPRQRALQEAFGLQVISPSSWGAQRIGELLTATRLRTVFSAGNGEIDIYELAVPKAWDGYPLAQVLPREGCVAVALTRVGSAMLPSGDTVLKVGDLVHLSATEDGIIALQRQLAQLQEA